MTKEQIKDNESEFDEWNPDEAKKIGSLKGSVEMKIDIDIEKSTDVHFSEPKMKKTIRTSVKIVDLKSKGNKKNKGTLF